MRRYSANYVYTNLGKPIRNGIVELNDDGVITKIYDPKGEIKELAFTEFYNGVIVPGFVNTHCHTELSYLKGKIKPNSGLHGFINQLNSHKLEGELNNETPIREAIAEMFRQGIVAVADICNKSVSFNGKKNSEIRFVNLIEVFGLEPDKAQHIIYKAKQILEVEQKKYPQEFQLTPHSTYSLSEQLWNLVRPEIQLNKLVSIHFAESKEESTFSEEQKGKLADSFIARGLPITSAPMGKQTDIVKNYIPQDANILFVHNTFLEKDQLDELIEYFDHPFFVLCPSSNLFIEGKLPNIEMLLEKDAEITFGTDSLASSPTLSILDQIIIIQAHSPNIPFSEVLKWATINGAKALGFEKELGTIEPDKKPGLNLITPFDFTNMKPSDNSRVRRLI